MWYALITPRRAGGTRECGRMTDKDAPLSALDATQTNLRTRMGWHMFSVVCIDIILVDYWEIPYSMN